MSARVPCPWYTEQQWKQIKSISLDSNHFDENYGEWLNWARINLERLQKQGLKVERVELNAEEWVKWCKEHHRQLNGESRSEYVIEKFEHLGELH